MAPIVKFILKKNDMGTSRYKFHTESVSKNDSISAAISRFTAIDISNFDNSIEVDSKMLYIIFDPNLPMLLV